jgi:hypothetical protein
VVTPDVQDSMMDAVKTQVLAQMRRTMSDSVTATVKSQISTAMRRTMSESTLTDMSGYGLTYR